MNLYEKALKNMIASPNHNFNADDIEAIEYVTHRPPLIEKDEDIKNKKERIEYIAANPKLYNLDILDINAMEYATKTVKYREMSNW